MCIENIMTHYYEKNIVDIKLEYTSYLINMLTPLIYEGFQSIYNHAIELHSKLNPSATDDLNKHPNLTKIFQICLKDIPSLSQSSIDMEVKRIKEYSRCSELFDDLIKAVVKSYIILLTFNASGKKCKLVIEKYHEKININDFIHKCYIECANIFYNNPELFWNESDKETQQVCKNNAYDCIKQGVIEAIHKILPVKDILREYLSNDYIEEIQEHKADDNSLSDNETDEHNNSETIKKKIIDVVEHSISDNDKDVLMPNDHDVNKNETTNEPNVAQTTKQVEHPRYERVGGEQPTNLVHNVQQGNAEIAQTQGVEQIPTVNPMPIVNPIQTVNPMPIVNPIPTVNPIQNIQPEMKGQPNVNISNPTQNEKPLSSNEIDKLFGDFINY